MLRPASIAFALTVLLATASTTFAEKPIKALLITGGCCHDYAKQKDILTQGISARANVEWTIIHEGGKMTRFDTLRPQWIPGEVYCGTSLPELPKLLEVGRQVQEIRRLQDQLDSRQ